MSDPAPSPAAPVLSLRTRLLIAAAVTLLQTAPDWVEAYTPGWDECWMLQAGLRWHRGEGLTTCMHSDWEDMAHPKHAHMFFWPPLHSWVFAALLDLGLSVPAALKGLTVLKAIAAFAGTLGWLRLAVRLLPDTLSAAFYALCLAGVFFASGADAGPNHIYFWALMPWILTAVLHSLRTGGNAGLVAAGLLGAVAVAYRFHAAYLVPGLGVAVLALSDGPWLRRLVRAAIPAAFPAATLGAMMLYNAQHKGPASWVTQLDAHWQFGNLFRREAFTYFSAFGFGLEEAIVKIKPSMVDETFLWFLPWYLVLACAAFVGVRRLVAVMDPERTRFVVLTAALSVFLVGMLMAISFRAEPAQGWLPVATERLYGEALPAVGLLWVLMFAEWWRRDPRHGARLFMAALSAVFVVSAVRPVFRTAKFDVRRVAAAFRDGFGREPPLLTRIRELLAASPAPAKAVFDAPFQTVSALRITDDVLAERFYGQGQLSGTGCSTDLYVIVVVRTRSADGSKRFWATDLGEDYARFFDLKPLEKMEDMGDYCEIFHGVQRPWPPGSRKFVDRPAP